MLLYSVAILKVYLNLFNCVQFQCPGINQSEIRRGSFSLFRHIALSKAWVTVKLRLSATFLLKISSYIGQKQSITLERVQKIKINKRSTKAPNQCITLVFILCSDMQPCVYFILERNNAD